MRAFSIGRVPRIEFGPGAADKLPAIVESHGRRALVVTGARSFKESDRWPRLQDGFRERRIEWLTLEVAGEPSPDLVDGAVERFRAEGIDVVVGIGGGSALDAGKAVAGLLKPGNSVMDHLEGVGPEASYRGPAVPFVAVPTTAGTGSEATRNAVLSRGGPQGFKKSFRHEALVARDAVVDPNLLSSCPPPLIAAQGLDAVAQLLESFVSIRSNLYCDALAASGLEAARDGLIPWFDRAGEHAAGTPAAMEAAGARSRMAYAALISGITLANAGLGAVHGIAAPLGAFMAIPHGAACGILAAPATRVNIEALAAADPCSPALEKFARAGRILASDPALEAGAARIALVALLESWTARVGLQRLGAFGVARSDIRRIAAESFGSSMKTNPVRLSEGDVIRILEEAL